MVWEGSSLSLVWEAAPWLCQEEAPETEVPLFTCTLPMAGPPLLTAGRYARRFMLRAPNWGKRLK